MDVFLIRLKDISSIYNRPDDSKSAIDDGINPIKSLILHFCSALHRICISAQERPVIQASRFGSFEQAVSSPYSNLLIVVHLPAAHLLIQGNTHQKEPYFIILAQ